MLTGVEDPYNLEVTSRLARTKLAPLYFVRSGHVYPANTAGTFRYAGTYGVYWSLWAAAYTSSTSATAYYLRVEPYAVRPSYGPSHRFNGFPLRCLSTVLDM